MWGSGGVRKRAKTRPLTFSPPLVLRGTYEYAAYVLTKEIGSDNQGDCCGMFFMRKDFLTKE